MTGLAPAFAWIRSSRSAQQTLRQLQSSGYEARRCATGDRTFVANSPEFPDSCPLIESVLFVEILEVLAAGPDILLVQLGDGGPTDPDGVTLKPGLNASPTVFRLTEDNLAARSEVSEAGHPTNNASEASFLSPLDHCSALLAATAWHDDRNHLSSIAPIHTEVTIHGNDRGLRIGFGHPHQARIRKRHRHSSEFVHQRSHRVDLCMQSEIDSRCGFRKF